MYRGIVELHLSYCCSVWGCCSESKIDVLRKIQNRAARIATSSPYDASPAPMIQNLGWSTISDLVGKETATLTYKSHEISVSAILFPQKVFNIVHYPGCLMRSNRFNFVRYEIGVNI